MSELKVTDGKGGFVSVRWVWGGWIDVHTIGQYSIVEYKSKSNETLFHPYVNGKDTNIGFDSMDEALTGAIAYKYEGPNCHAHKYFMRALHHLNGGPKD